MQIKMYDINNNDTIAAIATPHGVGAIAVIRISGDLSFNIIHRIFKPINNLKKIKSGRISLGFIFINKYILDKVLVNVFKRPKSYTGEDVIEISCHGSIYIQNKILELIMENGARLATRGEFTFRAFKNGKIDLYQVESLLDLFKSETYLEHKLAFNNLIGEGSILIKKLKNKMLYLNSIIDFCIDFSDENSSNFNKKEFIKTLNWIIYKVQELIKSFKIGCLFKKGIALAIIGKPNVGKSTLFNYLLKSERSIVSNKSGTTINYIEDYIYLNGIKYRIIDSAGITNKKPSNLERKGMKKTFENIKKAEIILFVSNKVNISLDKDDLLKKKIIFIINKCDLLKRKIKEPNDSILISAKYGIGIKTLLKKLVKISKRFLESDKKNLITKVRPYEELKRALFNLKEIKTKIKIGIEPELLSLLLRDTNSSLYKILGSISTSDILYNIFDNFCIGK
ncbi:tRNA uridine-5-carboxymethylaminomethyl(34) synthesis GTPase MnmE [Candidatus Karelsulcia muelleri]